MTNPSIIQQKTKSYERQFVSFYIDDQMYGIDIGIIKEVNGKTDISEVPLSSSHVKGLVNLRGQIVLVLDIAVIFGKKPRVITEESQLVIFKHFREVVLLNDSYENLKINMLGDKPVSFLVDRIGDVVTLDSDSIEPVPSHFDEDKTKYIRGVAHLKDKLFVILDALELLSIDNDSDNDDAEKMKNSI